MIETKSKINKTLDVFKAVCCIIVTAAHLPPIFADELKSAYFNQWFLRFCVPFFFVCSGYFFEKSHDKRKNLRRVGWLFALAYVIYLPPILQDAANLSEIISKVRWNLVIGYEHLWYLSAALEGMIIWYVLERIPGVRTVFAKFGTLAGVLLLLLGALLDEHYPLLNIPLLTTLGEFMQRFGGPRNVVFMGLPLMLFGGAIARREDRVRKIPVVALAAAWMLLRALAFWECGYLFEYRGLGITNDLTLFGCWPAVILFVLSFKWNLPIPDGLATMLRKLSEYVYILHPWAAMWISKYIFLEPVPLWIGTIAFCSVIYYFLEKQFVIQRKI